MRQIFMCYAHSDEIFADQLTGDLLATGANVWLDIRHAEPGRHWARSIEQALIDSHMMIVVLSPEALNAPHVNAEWQAYLEAHRPVVPVLVAACDAPGPLRTRTPIDFTRERDYDKAFHRLSMRLLEYDTRTRRRAPVIWNLARTLQERHEQAAAEVVSAAPPDPEEPVKTEESAPGMGQMIRNHLMGLAWRWESST